MIKEKIKKIVSTFKQYQIDGYIIPKNDSFFSENVRHDRLRIISNFSGSAGIAIILKRKNFLFVDGRYTLQAKSESGENFQIIEIPKQLPKNILNKLKLGFDPNLFTKAQLNYFFGKNIRFKQINENLVDIVKYFPCEPITVYEGNHQNY